MRICFRAKGFCALLFFLIFGCQKSSVKNHRKNVSDHKETRDNLVETRKSNESSFFLMSDIYDEFNASGISIPSNEAGTAFVLGKAGQKNIDCNKF